MRWASILVLAAGVLNAAEDWPQFRGNPRLTGATAGNVPVALKLIWTYDAGEAIESSAAILGDTVYVGSRSKGLLAIDLNTGKLKRKYRASDAIGESSPAVFEGIVYIGDLGGVLHAVNAAKHDAVESRVIPRLGASGVTRMPSHSAPRGGVVWSNSHFSRIGILLT